MVNLIVGSTLIVVYYGDIPHNEGIYFEQLEFSIVWPHDGISLLQLS